MFGRPEPVSRGQRGGSRYLEVARECAVSRVLRLNWSASSSTATTSGRFIRAAQARGAAHGSASGSRASAPRPRNSLTSSLRPHRHAQPSGVLLEQVVAHVETAPPSRRSVAIASRSSAVDVSCGHPPQTSWRMVRPVRTGRIRAGAVQHQPETRQVAGSIGFGMRAERPHQMPVPPGIAGRPIEMFQRQPDDLHLPAVGAVDEQFGGRAGVPASSRVRDRPVRNTR